MHTRTRCFSHGSLTPMLALSRNALSHDPVLGPQSMSQWMEFWRPRVARYAAPYRLGLRRPTLSLAEVVEHALVSMAAELNTCSAITDEEMYCWVSVRTARTVLDLYAAYRAASCTTCGRPQMPAATYAA